MARNADAYPPSPQPAPANPALELAKHYWLPILLAVVAVIFIAQNRSQFDFNFLWFEVSMPQWLALTVITAIGIALGWFLGVRRYKRKNAAE